MNAYHNCFPQQIASGFFTAIIAERPNVAGVLLILVSVARVFYARGYKSNIVDRFPFFLFAQFAGSVGIGYGLLVALSGCGVGRFVQ